MNLIHVKIKGHGHFCTVKQLIDETTGISYARKELKKQHYNNQDYIYRLNKEISYLKELQDCENIISVIDDGKDENNIPWFLMPYADDNLYNYIRKNNTKLSLEERIAIIDQVINAVKFAHSKSILHRDIAPNNVLIFFKNDVPNIKVSDFGLGKDQESLSFYTTSSISNYGQAYYVSPEQKEKLKNADVRSDLYSLGKLVYFILTGKDPVNFSLSEFYSLIIKSSEEDPNSRYQTIEEFEEAFVDLCKVYQNKKYDINQLTINDIIEIGFDKHQKTLLELLHSGRNVTNIFHDYLLPTTTLLLKQSNLQLIFNNQKSDLKLFLQTYAKMLRKCTETWDWDWEKINDFSKLLINIIKSNNDDEIKLLCFNELWHLAFTLDQWKVQDALLSIFNNTYIEESMVPQLIEYILHSNVAVDYERFRNLKISFNLKNALLKNNENIKEIEKRKAEVKRSKISNIDF